VQPSHARRQNLSLALQALYTNGPMSRADLARSLGLTKVTVSELVTALLERGHAIEVGRSTPGRLGKPAILVDVNRTGLQVIGLDLSDHRALHGAVLDLDGTVIARAQRPFMAVDSVAEVPVAEEAGGGGTQRPAGLISGQRAVDLVLELVAECLTLATAPILGIGIGTPGIVGCDGVVQTAPNLDWHEVPLRDIVASATNLPVSLCNDADAAAHADYTLGDGGDDQVLVRIGRGVGSGLIVGGRRVRGAHCAAGEIGHVVVGTDGGHLCRCGKVGCLETWVSAPRLEQALAASAAGAAPGAGGSSDGAEAVAAAGQRLAIALAPVVAALDLADVVLCGPSHVIVPALVESVESTLRSRLFTVENATLRVRVVDDPNDIVVRGAAALVLLDQLGVS